MSWFVKPYNIYIFLLIYRRGPVRYRFQGLYELDSLAIVNVRDAGPVKNAFKMLMFPDAKMYQADGAKAKVCNILYTLMLIFAGVKLDMAMTLDKSIQTVVKFLILIKPGFS